MTEYYAEYTVKARNKYFGSDDEAVSFFLGKQTEKEKLLVVYKESNSSTGFIIVYEDPNRPK